MAGVKLSKIEKDYIDLNWSKETDKEMAAKLKRDKKTIFKYRVEMGYSKNKNAAFTPSTPVVMDDGSIGVAAKEMSSRLNDEERKEFFARQLKNSKFYTLLTKSFSEEELDYYCEEYGALCVQFSDILSSERRQLDELIKIQILINRALAYIKRTDDEVATYAKMIDEFRKSHDMKEDEEAQAIDDQNIYLVRQMSSACQQMSNDYNKLLASKNSILESLNARRKDRIDQLTNKKTTFAGLVEAIMQDDVKAIQGRHIALIKSSRENLKKKWTKPSVYCDGSSDIILYDDESDIDALTKNSREAIEKIGEDTHADSQQSTDSGDDNK